MTLRKTWKTVKDILAALAIAFAGFAVLWGVFVGIPKLACWQDWGDSGMPWRYVLVKGCQVSPTPGVWLPAKAYRAVSPQ